MAVGAGSYAINDLTAFDALKAQLAGIMGDAIPTNADLKTIEAGLKATNVSANVSGAVNSAVTNVVGDRQAALDAQNGYVVAGPDAAKSTVAGSTSPAALLASTYAGSAGGLNPEQAKAFMAGLPDDVRAKLAGALSSNDPKALEAFVAGVDANTNAYMAKWGISIIEIVKVAVITGLIPEPPIPLPKLPGFPGCDICPRPNPLDIFNPIPSVTPVRGR